MNLRKHYHMRCFVNNLLSDRNVKIVLGGSFIARVSQREYRPKEYFIITTLHNKVVLKVHLFHLKVAQAFKCRLQEERLFVVSMHPLYLTRIWLYCMDIK